MLLSDFLGRLSEVRAVGAGWLAVCPAHPDHRPSLAVDLSQDAEGQPSLLLHCRAGCAKPAVLEALGLTMRDLFRVQVDLDGITVQAGGPAAAPPAGAIALLAQYVAATSEVLQTSEEPWAERARAYLVDRFGLDLETAASLGLGVDLGGTAHDLEWLSDTYRAVPRLTVPFRDFQGVARGLQARDLTGQHRVRWCGLTNPEGAAWARLAAFSLESGLDFVLLTEGPGDALTAVGAGLDAVAIRGAALADPSTVATLAPHLQGRQVILAGDADRAGQDYNRALAEALGAHGVNTRVLELPDGEDLTSWRGEDPEGFQERLDRALGYTRPTAGTGRPQGATEHPHTELGNAERLLEHLGHQVRYTDEAGFYLWTGTHWRLDTLNAVRTAAQDVARAIVAEGRETLRRLQREPDWDPDSPEAKEAKALVAWGLRSQTSRALDGMVKELQALRGVALDLESVDSHPDLLAFRNGVVNLRTGDLQPHDPGLMLTRCLPFDFDPTAQAPRWEEFLEQVFPQHPEMPAYMRRLVGYGITGRTSEQCFAVMWGKGANGKSVFTDTLTEVFRPITSTTPFSTFESKPSGGIPNDLAALKGARLVLASEGEQGRVMAESLIKRVTGSDLIAARFMRREFFEFRPTFLILLATNHKPTFRGQDEGLWRRVKLIPWTRYFSPAERDHGLTNYLTTQEAAGIAAWAVRGAAEWYAQGLGDPESVRDATSDFRETSDELAGFFPGVLVRAPGETILGAKVMEAYRAWADEEGILRQWERRTLFGALEERGVPRHKSKKGVVFHGLRLATPADSYEDPEPVHDLDDITQDVDTPEAPTFTADDARAKVQAPGGPEVPAVTVEDLFL